MSAARDFADRTWFVVASRASMLATPFLVAGLFWLGPQWLDQRYAQATELALVKADVAIVNANMANRGSARDAQVGNVVSQVTALDHRLDGVEATTAASLSKNTDALNSLSNEVSGLNASVRLLLNERPSP